MPDEQPRQFTSSPEQWDKLKPLARQMRHEPTSAEKLLWQRLRSRRIGGAKFRRQHAIAGFIVDFVCVESRLIIEVDGSVHELVDQQLYDAERQSILEGHGFRLLRFTNDELFRSLDAVAEQIGKALDEMER